MASVDTQAPVFSVVLPTHNRAALLARAIASVLSQSFEDYELLVVDDMSSDPTDQVASAFADPRLRYIRRTTNGGAAATRNTGIELARGRYVAFLDDDDEYDSRFLASTFSVLSSSPRSVGLSWCGVQFFDESPERTEVSRCAPWQPSFPNRHAAYVAFLARRMVGTNFGLVVRRDCFATVGLFDQQMACAEDTDLLIRLVRRYDFVVVPDVLVTVHRHTGPRLTAYGANMAHAYERMIAKHSTALAAHPDVCAEIHYKAGWLYYRAGDRRNARRHMRKSLACQPMRAKSWLGLALYETTGVAGGSALHTWMSTWFDKVGARFG